MMMKNYYVDVWVQYVNAPHLNRRYDVRRVYFRYAFQALLYLLLPAWGPVDYSYVVKRSNVWGGTDREDVTLMLKAWLLFSLVVGVGACVLMLTARLRGVA